jgi:serine/threonine protein kinase
MQLKTILILLEGAVCPEDVFGKLNGEPLNKIFRRLAKVTHPDKFTGADKTHAEKAFKTLQEWYEKAEAKVTAGTYGDRTVTDAVVILTKTEKYEVQRKLTSGDISDVFLARNRAGQDVILKITRTPANNDLLANEAKTLRYFRTDAPTKDLKVMIHIPVLLDSFELRDAKAKKRINVLAAHEGECYTLAQVHNAFPAGIDLRDAAWMWNRLLAALLAAHQSNIIHAAIIPEHFLVFPKTHNGILLDWSYAVKPDISVKAISPARRDFYPPEIFTKKPVNFGVDLYMAAVCMLYLLGGDTKTRAFPNSVPVQIRGLLRTCWLGTAHRPKDVWELYTDFDALLKALYGPRKFRHFVMPESASSTTK